MSQPRKKQIFFIDDDEDDFLLLHDVFGENREDVELRWIKDSEQALEQLMRADSPPPSLILLDLNMPKLSGREVLRQIRNQQSLKHIPVVVLTNSINKAESVEAFRLGVNSFLRKPSGYKELAEFVRIFCRYWFDHSTIS